MTTFLLIVLLIIVVGLATYVAQLVAANKKYGKALIQALAPKPFGLAQLTAVATQISLTAETVRAAIVAATVVGMKNTVSDDIKQRRGEIGNGIADAHNRIYNSESAIADLKTSISNERRTIEKYEASDTYLSGIAALLPPVPAAEKK